jgi:hypothetical protein
MRLAALAATRTFVQGADPEIWDISVAWSSYQDAEHKIPGEDAKPLFVRLWKRNTPGQDGHTVLIGLQVETWRWKDISHPNDLLGTLHYLTTVLKINVEWSYETMSTTFLKSQVKDQSWLRPASTDLKSVFKGAARDLKWFNHHIQPELGQWAICYDVNSAYLSGFTGGLLGVGDPMHRAAGEIVDTKLPGAYRVAIEMGDSVFDEERLPRVFAKSEWVTHDLLLFMNDAKYQVEVLEAWQFEESHRVVGPAASALWAARDILHPDRGDTKNFPSSICRRNAYESIKRIALPLPGRFANAKTPVYRPDWWESGVGRARATQLRRLLKLFELGYVPGWIYGDSLYFFTTDKNPATAVPGMLDRQDKLGGYKCNGVVPVTQEVLDCWSTGSFAKMTTLFAHLAKTPMTGE